MCVSYVPNHRNFHGHKRDTLQRLHIRNREKLNGLERPLASPSAQCLLDSRAVTFEDVVRKRTDIIHKVHFPDAEADEWIQALNNRDAYAYVAVLLSQLSDIETLQLDYSFVWMGGYPGRMVKHCLLAKNGSCRVASYTFDALQSVDLWWKCPSSYILKWKIQCLMGFPLL